MAGCAIAAVTAGVAAAPDRTSITQSMAAHWYLDATHTHITLHIYIYMFIVSKFERGKKKCVILQIVFAQQPCLSSLVPT